MSITHAPVSGSSIRRGIAGCDIEQGAIVEGAVLRDRGPFERLLGTGSGGRKGNRLVIDEQQDLVLRINPNQHICTFAEQQARILQTLQHGLRTASPAAQLGAARVTAWAFTVRGGQLIQIALLQYGEQSVGELEPLRHIGTIHGMCQSREIGRRRAQGSGVRGNKAGEAEHGQRLAANA